jgi:hypothetical protein
VNAGGRKMFVAGATATPRRTSMVTGTATVKAAIMRGETLISTVCAARQLPSGKEGKALSPATVFKWIRHGVLATTGERVRLEGVRIGRGWYTSAEAIGRFTRALAGDDQEAREPAEATPTPLGASEAARRLEALGA